LKERVTFSDVVSAARRAGGKKSPRKPQPQLPPPQAQKGVVRITSITGARIVAIPAAAGDPRWEGLIDRDGGVVAELEAGRYTLIASKGDDYLAVTQVWDVAEGSSANVNLPLTPKPSEITVEATYAGRPVAGAYVMEGSTSRGKANVPIELASGTHVLVVRAAGYQDAVLELNIEPNTSSTHPVPLTPVPATVRISTSVPQASVNIVPPTGPNETLIADAHGYAQTNLCQGLYSFVAEKSGYRTSRKTVRIGKEGAQVELPMVAKHVEVTVNCNVPAAVYDMTQTIPFGRTGTPFGMPPGSTTNLLVVAPGYEDMYCPVEVKIGTPVTVTATLRKQKQAVVVPVASAFNFEMYVAGYETFSPLVRAEIKRLMSARSTGTLSDFLCRATVAALKGYGGRGDRRMLGLARGLVVAGAVTEDKRDFDGTLQVLKEWKRRMRSEGDLFDKYLPLPALEGFGSRNTSDVSWPIDVDLPSCGKRVPGIGVLALPPQISIPVHQTSRVVSPQLVRDSLRSKQKIGMVLVPEGEGLIRAAPSGIETEDEEYGVTHPFYIAAKETTLGAFRSFVVTVSNEDQTDALGSIPRDRLYALDSLPPLRDLKGADDEVYGGASLDQALSFCNWLSQLCNRKPVYTHMEDGTWRSDPTADGIRLPTANDWQYAARYGFDFRRFPGTASWDTMQDDLGSVMYGGRGSINRDMIRMFETSPRPSPRDDSVAFPYPIGVTDMCGNLAELCIAGSMRDEDLVPVAVGGDYSGVTPAMVMPWRCDAPADVAEGALGFRVILVVPVDDLLGQ